MTGERRSRGGTGLVPSQASARAGIVDTPGAKERARWRQVDISDTLGRRFPGNADPWEAYLYFGLCAATASTRIFINCPKTQRESPQKGETPESL